MLIALGLVVGSAACAPGTFEVSVYGEDFIEVGVPADAVVDGWAVEFERFELTVTEVEAGGVRFSGGAFDLTEATGGAGQLVDAREAPAGRYTELAYTVASPIFVQGRATRGDEVRTFAWELETETRYAGCQIDAELTPEGGAASQLTVHADHLFYDDLIDTAPDLRFDALADADTDGDGEITRAELEATDISGFARYQVGNFTEVTDLWAYLEAQSRTLGHIDGEGHCDVVR